ncbi:MAG: type 4b pilus protein PilO2 [Alphaproteobacteria bacterium]|nr:type 4b pilus protein PilO2 [Alphaproteobacteria bacterium]
MTTAVVSVGRKQYVSGLYWENSPSGRISQAAKEAAHQPGSNYDFYTTRSGNKQGRVPQFGLASAGPGLHSGLPSLGGCLANQQPGSWIGAFRLREGSALVIVRDDLLVPDGDLFFADEVEARDRLYQELAIGGFQRIYAPEAWGVPDADTMPLTLLLNDRVDVKLRSVVVSKQSKIALIGGSLLLAGFIGVGLYIQDTREKEESLRMEQMAALERMRQEAARLMPGVGTHPDYPKPERTWELQPKPMVFIRACQNALQKVSMRVAGWDVTSISCKRNTLLVRYSRRGGHSNYPKGAVVTDTGEYAELSVPLEVLAPRPVEQLVDPDVITRRYLNQNWSATIGREPDDPPPPPPPSYSGEWNPPPAPWIKRSFTFTVPVLPWTLESFIGDLPGVIIWSAVLSGDGLETRNSWKVEGVIYENRR